MTEPILYVDLGKYNGVLTFYSVDEIKDFFHREYEFLNWIGSLSNGTLMSNLWGRIGRKLNEVQSQMGYLTVDDLSRINHLKNAVEEAYNNTKIPLSTSAVGKFIKTLFDENPSTAAAALALWTNSSGINYADFAHAKGAMLMALFDVNLTPETASSVKASLEELQQSFQVSRAKTEQETSEQRKIFASNLLHQRNAIAKNIRTMRRELRTFRDKKAEETRSAIASVQGTEQLYREHMRLKGPVEYWSKKATQHQSKAKTYRNILVGFGAIGGSILILALFCIASHAISIATSDKPPAIYLILVTIGVVLSTIIFWAARILTRLFLSEHHLAVDAEERAVMAQTYLALTAEGQATEAERGIVLSSLFRPTADGIVKDDAAPDISPATLLARFGTK